MRRPADQEEVLDRFGELAVAVGEFLADRPDVVLRIGGGDGAVRLEAQPLAGGVVVGDVGVDRELDLDLQGRLLLHAAFEGGPVVGDRLAHHAYVQVEADARDVTGLLAAQEVSGAADLQVLHRHVHARTHLGVLGDRGEALVGRLGERLLRG